MILEIHQTPTNHERLRKQHFYLGYRYALGATKLLMLVAQRATNHSRNLTSPACVKCDVFSWSFMSQKCVLCLLVVHALSLSCQSTMHLVDLPPLQPRAIDDAVSLQLIHTPLLIFNNYLIQAHMEVFLLGTKLCPSEQDIGMIECVDEILPDITDYISC